MKARRRFPRFLPLCLTVWAALWLAGCQNVFVAKQKVLVDAISAPGATKPAGQSYRLVGKKTMISQGQAQVPVVKACIDAALASQGMFEPPPNVAPDLFIEVGFGTDASARVDPASRETFLQLSARSNPERSPDRATGSEVWDVRVAVLGLTGRIEGAMPLLSWVAVTYMGTDTHVETKVDIPRNSPEVVAVREGAIKALESKAGPNPPSDPNAPVGSPEAANSSAPTPEAAAKAELTPVK